MAKQEPSALTEAATAFETELATYTRLGELFVKTPLSSVKFLERANATLADIAACEGRLQTAGQLLVQALSAARSQQEELAKDVVEHVPAVQERNKRLQELMAELAGVATEVSGLNAIITRAGTAADATPSAADAQSISTTVLALSVRAEQLATTAREAEFEELATQAHALHQKLQAIGKKLALVGSAAN